MHFSLQGLLLLLAAITTALSAGLLFAYSVSVNPGLGQLADAPYLQAMQGINRAIQNPVFFCVYFGPLALLPLSAWMMYGRPVPPAFILLLTASLLYIAGVAGVTIAGNVPLNEGLARFDVVTATADALRRQRGLFEAPWNRLHAIRTLAAIASLALVLIVLIRYPLRVAGKV